MNERTNISEDDDSSVQNTAIGPLPAFQFKVMLETDNALQGVFQEVSGLTSETQVIDYRHSASLEHSTIKMPGLNKIGNAVLKRGIFEDNNTFWTWYSSIGLATIKRQTIVIELLDESNAPRMKWTLANAWPSKISGVDMKAAGNEVAVHTIELAFEILQVNVA